MTGIDQTRGRSVPRPKTAVPRLPAVFVSRAELRVALTRLSAATPVTLVCAPAGYGKTLLLADWVAATGTDDKAWVSLDGSDNDADRFWTAVLCALRSCPTVPPTSGLHRLSPAEPGFLAEVIDALAALPAPLYLVLDDLHEVAGERTWHGIATLVRHQPKSVHIVLSSRADPPLPLARLRLQDRLAELRAAELRFSPAHATELLRLAGVELTHDQVHELVAQTDGWPAGLRLAARSLLHSPDRAAFLTEFARSDHAVADFLVNEVLARLPAATTDVLRLVSICDEVTPDLAAELTGRPDAGAILADLERDSSLVLAVGADRSWFRPHPLLRAYLRADLHRQRPGVVARLHEIAAAWFAAEEQPDKAFDHASSAPTTVALLRRHATSLLLAGDDHDTVRRTMTKAGEEVAGCPRLALVSALAHLTAGDRTAADADLATSLAVWPTDPDTELVLLRQLVLTTRALLSFQPPGSFDWPDTTDDAMAAWTRLARGWARCCAGEVREARRELEGVGHGFAFLTFHSRSVLGVLSAQEGDFTEMAAACGSAIEVAAARGWTTAPWLAVDHLMVGCAHALSLEPAAAMDRVRRAAGPDACALRRYLLDLVAGVASIDLGRPLEGVRLLHRARHDHGSVPNRLLLTGALLEHRCVLGLGHTVLARQLVRWTRERFGSAVELSLMQAWTAFADGALPSAERALRAVVDADPLTQLEARLLETALEIRLGRRPKAREALRAALALAEPAMVVRPFRHADPSVRRLLVEQAGGFGHVNDFATLVSLKLAGKPAAALTNREHAVLVALSSPRSFEELASDMSVSVNTVKTHVRAIYAKLGVHNRRAAVIASRRLGLNVGTPPTRHR